MIVYVFSDLFGFLVWCRFIKIILVYDFFENLFLYIWVYVDVVEFLLVFFLL